MTDRNYGGAEIELAAHPPTWELWNVPQDHIEAIYHRFPEFTCLCPRSGYPDFATVHLVIVPHFKVVELKDLKLWFNSFRDRRVSHEDATAEIARTLHNILWPWYLFVLMEYSPRGNLMTFPTTQYHDPASPSHDDPAAQTYQDALVSAYAIRSAVISSVIGEAQR